MTDHRAKIKEELNKHKMACSKCEYRKDCDDLEYSSCAAALFFNKLAEARELNEEMIEPLVNCLALYYEHCKNDHQINYINETAKKLLKDYHV